MHASNCSLESFISSISLTQLKMLENFEVRAFAEGCRMSLCFAWGLMSSLKSFTFESQESQEFDFGSDLIGLTQLSRLSRAQFSICHPVDYAILRRLRSLMYILARNSPDVSFWLNDYCVESDRCVIIGGPQISDSIYHLFACKVLVYSGLARVIEGWTRKYQTFMCYFKAKANLQTRETSLHS